MRMTAKYPTLGLTTALTKDLQCTVYLWVSVKVESYKPSDGAYACLRLKISHCWNNIDKFAKYFQIKLNEVLFNRQRVQLGIQIKIGEDKQAA